MNQIPSAAQGLTVIDPAKLKDLRIKAAAFDELVQIADRVGFDHIKVPGCSQLVWLSQWSIKLSTQDNLNDALMRIGQERLGL